MPAHPFKQGCIRGDVGQAAREKRPRPQGGAVSSYAGVVKRGVDLPASVLDDIQPGRTTTFKEFFSSSATRAFPGNTQFTISSLAGKDIQPLSQVPSESEVLFRPGTTFDVISKVQDAAGTWHIALSEVR